MGCKDGATIKIIVNQRSCTLPSCLIIFSGSYLCNTSMAASSRSTRSHGTAASVTKMTKTLIACFLLSQTENLNPTVFLNSAREFNKKKNRNAPLTHDSFKRLWRRRSPWQVSVFRRFSHYNLAVIKKKALPAVSCSAAAAAAIWVNRSGVKHKTNRHGNGAA